MTKIAQIGVKRCPALLIEVSLICPRHAKEAYTSSKFAEPI